MLGEMKSLMKSWTIGILGAFVAVTVLLSLALVPEVRGASVNFSLYKWSYTNTYYKFWYKDTYGKAISYRLSRYSTYGTKPFLAAGRVLGTYTKPSGRIDVYVDPTSSGSGYGGHFWFKSGSTSGLRGQYIYMKASRSTSGSSLLTYGGILAHESSHLIYMNYTRGYTLSWFWNSSYNGFKRDRALTESIAYYTGSCYYPRYVGSSSYYSYAKIKGQIKGYAQLVETSAYRYTHSGFTTKDWWNFHAFGYWLSATGKLQNVVTYLRYYISKKNNYAFQNAYQSAYGLRWTDGISASTQKGSSYSGYLYYRYYWYWNS